MIFIFLQRAVWVLAGVAMAAVVTSGELDVGRQMLFPVLWVFLWGLDEKRILPKASRGQTLLVASWLALSLARFLFKQAPFLMVMSDFLLGFLFLKGAFAKELQDLRQMVALSFFVLLAAASLSLNAVFFLWFVLYTLLAAVVLSLLTLQRFEAQAVPADRSLGPILSTLFKISGISLACALGLAVLMFLFFPRWSNAVFQGRFLGPLRRAGYTEGVNLQSSGEIYRDARMILRVETPAPWDGYLRGATLSRFDGRAWAVEPSSPTLLRGPARIENRFVLPGVGRSGLRLRRQKIYLEAIDSSTLFAAPWVREISVALPRLLVLADGTLRRAPGQQGRLLYTVVSEDASPLEPRPDPGEPVLQLPGPEAEWGRLRAMGDTLLSRRDAPAVKADKLTRYLQTQCTYSLDGGPGNVARPVEAFLFEEKKGHCEHFASALVVLLRLQEIPARVVSGFRAHERNGDGAYYMVRAQDAHAWVEAWVDGRWRRYDPTPGDRFANPPPTYWRRWRERVDYVNFLWNIHVLTYDAQSQMELASSTIQSAQQWDNQMERFLHRWGRVSGQGGRKLLGGWRVWSVGLFLGGVLIYLRWKFRNKRRGFQGQGPIVFYREALTLLERRGVRRRPVDTPREILQRLQGQPEVAKPFATLTSLYESIRFGGQSLTAEDQSLIQTTLRQLQKIPTPETI